MDVATGMIAVVPAIVKGRALEKQASFSLACPEINKTVIAVAGGSHGELPAGVHAFVADSADLFAPPPRLALLERVAAWSEKKDGDPVRMVVHFDPNRPVSDGTIIFECLQRLIINGLADGLVGVRRQGEGGARWMEKDGWLVPGEGTWFETGELYVIRPDFLHRREPDWRGGGHWLPYDLDAARPGGSLY